jgi:hypothetical protein
MQRGELVRLSTNTGPPYTEALVESEEYGYLARVVD